MEAPFTTGAVPPAGVGEHSAYNYVLASGDYVLNTLQGNVLVVGNARLLVRSNTSVGTIVISTNASLQIFCAGTAAFGTVSNRADVTGFQFYGLASNQNVSFGAGFVKGLIYAPNAFCGLNFGGANWYDFYGACVVRYLSAIHWRIHFDEQLKRYCVP